MSLQLRKDVEVLQPKLYGGEERTINVDEVRQLVSLVFRLEALSSSKLSAERHKAMTQSTFSPQPAQLELAAPLDTSNNPLSETPTIMQGETQSSGLADDGPSAFNGMAIRALSPSHLLHQASYLGPRVSEDMTDEELTGVLESLLIRLENALSTLVSDPQPLKNVLRLTASTIPIHQLLKQIGDVYPVLAGLAELTKIDTPSLISALSAFAALV